MAVLALGIIIPLVSKKIGPNGCCVCTVNPFVSQNSSPCFATHTMLKELTESAVKTKLQASGSVRFSSAPAVM
jgi:hypothetical protein